MSEDELLDLVNENDEVIGEVWKSEAHKDPSKIHREVAIVVSNEKDEVLLQQRSFKKEHHPGMWAGTAGHVGKGEKPEIAAKRELLEELGWKKRISFLGKLFAQDNKESRFFWIFKCEVKGRPKVNYNKIEIEEIKWLDYKNLENFAKKNDYRMGGTTDKILKKVFD